MSNKPSRRKRNATADIGPNTVIGKIAAATGEQPRDVEAAIVTLVTAGNAFDDVWEWMKDAINDGEGIVHMAERRLGNPN